jgi:hypothetical protein
MIGFGSSVFARSDLFPVKMNVIFVRLKPTLKTFYIRHFLQFLVIVSLFGFKNALMSTATCIPVTCT